LKRFNDLVSQGIRKRFFFEKRTKNLLLIWASAGFTSTAKTHKSFLLLFFKKEVLVFLNKLTPQVQPFPPVFPRLPAPGGDSCGG
jgi:hypothetical protein